jgi:hypothetical protein
VEWQEWHGAWRSWKESANAIPASTNTLIGWSTLGENKCGRTPKEFDRKQVVISSVSSELSEAVHHWQRHVAADFQMTTEWGLSNSICNYKALLAIHGIAQQMYFRDDDIYD